MDRLLDTTLVEVPLNQPAQQLAALGLHHGFQRTMGYPLVLLVAESAQQVFKLRKGIRVVLDRSGSDRISCHRRGLLGYVAKDSYLEFRTPNEAPSSVFFRRHLAKPLFPRYYASS